MDEVCEKAGERVCGSDLDGVSLDKLARAYIQTSTAERWRFLRSWGDSVDSAVDRVGEAGGGWDESDVWIVDALLARVESGSVMSTAGIEWTLAASERRSVVVDKDGPRLESFGLGPSSSWDTILSIGGSVSGTSTCWMPMPRGAS
jgi:hypothetical protein